MATTIRDEIDVPIRRVTVVDYQRMADAGILAEKERVELLDGVLIEMPPLGYRHEYAVRALGNALWATLGGRAIVQMNGSIVLGPASQPQPDVVILRGPNERYRQRLPEAADVLLLIEVAHTSRAYDRGPKARAYARAGIAELWLVDLVAGEVVVRRSPAADGYAKESVHRRGDLVVPGAFPDAKLAVSDFVDAASPPR